MKQTLILLAGFPGTGKSYLANMIKKQFPFFHICSPDDLKEKFWDEYGFEGLEEKERLINLSWKAYYEELEKLFKQHKFVLSDYPFSEKQYTKLKILAEKYDVQVVTIRMIGDLQVLFDRQKKRDLDDTRHLGHIVNCYHKGMHICHDHADNLLDKDEFIKRCTTRGYDKFKLGYLIELDVSDFTKVDYEGVLQSVKEYME